MNKLSRNYYLFFLISSLMILFLCLPYRLFAQNFNRGLAYYKAKNYKQAAAVFKNLSSSQADLFLGKSYYALGQYREALAALGKVSPDSLSQLFMEAEYTSALVNYQQKEFGESLTKLFDVFRATASSSLKSDAKELYRQILNYLTASQRERIIAAGNIPDEIKFNLLETSLGKIPFARAVALYQAFTQNVRNSQWKDQLKKIHSNLKNASAYRSAYGSRGKLQPPEGTIYHIGIALPGYKSNNRNYGVVRGIYLGAVLAADQYNQDHDHTRVLVHFVNTGGDSGTMKNAVKDFTSQNYGDVLIGPLFSKQIQPMLSLTSNLHIPAVAPLANKSVNLKNSWLFQANPTYEVQGKKMAEFAVNELSFNRFTIISDVNSRGAAAARAFRKEAEKLGATITHYFVQNLGSEYEFSKYTRYFGASPVPIKAVYAPLNGSNALTLIDLLLRKIRTVSHHITVLGAQEWGNHHFESAKNANIDVYYSKSDQQTRSGRLNRFKRDYRQTFKTTGNEFSIIGYDIATFILEALNRAGNPGLLRSTITNQPRYNGLTRDIYFGGMHVNQAIHVIHVSGP